MAKQARRSSSPRTTKTSAKRATGRGRVKTAVRNGAARKTSARKTSARKSSVTKTSARKTSQRRWSHAVTEHSDALDLKQGVFTLSDPKKIAASLKRSAEHSHRRKSDPYRSAMSMITFYINRGGHNLSARRKAVLDRAKEELRRQFGRA